jgi:hypothetical protein
MVSSVVSTLSIFLPAPTVVMTSAALSTSTTTRGLNIIGKLSYLDVPGSSGIEGPANLRVDVFAVFVRCKVNHLDALTNLESLRRQI